MRQYEEYDRKSAGESARQTLMLIAFSLTILIFLVAIGEEDWFSIRPASGVASALWMTSASPEEGQKATTDKQGKS